MDGHSYYWYRCSECGWRWQEEDLEPCPRCGHTDESLTECDDCTEDVPGAQCCGDCEDMNEEAR